MEVMALHPRVFKPEDKYLMLKKRKKKKNDDLCCVVTFDGCCCWWRRRRKCEGEFEVEIGNAVTKHT